MNRVISHAVNNILENTKQEVWSNPGRDTRLHMWHKLDEYFTPNTRGFKYGYISANTRQRKGNKHTNAQEWARGRCVTLVSVHLSCICVYYRWSSKTSPGHFSNFGEPLPCAVSDFCSWLMRAKSEMLFCSPQLYRVLIWATKALLF